MKKQLLTIFGVAALGMASYAATFMQVKTDDGKTSSIHSYVDLGLPSGTLWATYNIGATKPEEYGWYFAWGETEPKDVYYWSTYKYAKANEDGKLDSITKYNMSGRYGIIDSLSTLLSEDDAATANWGSDWRMPTNEEQRELQKNSYMVWTDGYNGTDVKGVIFYKAKSTGDKGKYAYCSEMLSADYNVSSDAHVFLPAAMDQWDDVLQWDHVLRGDYGSYWSSSLSEQNEGTAFYLDFEENNLDWHGFGRDRPNGFPVRAVRAKKAERKMYIVKFYTSDSILIESQEVLEGASAKEIQAPEKNGYDFIGWSASLDKITSDMSVYALYKQMIPSDTLLSNHPYVDLGLPSGTLWATYNVGASKPEEYGDYFAWGETEPKEVYDWSTYKWSTNYYMTKYNSEDGLTTLLSEDDAATANWGKEWRMPTNEEQRELKENSYMVWTDDYNGTDVRGVIFYKVKNSDDKGDFVASWDTPSSDYSVSSDAHVFLPAADEFIRDNVLFGYGRYWSSSLGEYDEENARVVKIYRDEVDYGGGSDCIRGLPVRAVRAK